MQLRSVPNLRSASGLAYAAAAADVEKNVVVPITKDKGLCGGINTTVCKYARATLKIADEDGAPLSEPAYVAH